MWASVVLHVSVRVPLPQRALWRDDLDENRVNQDEKRRSSGEMIVAVCGIGKG